MPNTKTNGIHGHGWYRNCIGNVDSDLECEDTVIKAEASTINLKLIRQIIVYKLKYLEIATTNK